MSNKRAIHTTIYNIYPKNLITLIVNVLSVMVSWYFNKSLGWAIFHFMFGWIYLLYSFIIGRFKDGGFMEIINSYI